MSRSFDYSIAFSRNLGLLTPEEQARVKKTLIVIPGMGGVGGAHLISLVRQGFENFKIADPDIFELHNFNRQYGADLDHMGRKKTDVLKERALSINPHCRIQTFDDGITPENIDTFLEGANLAVDGLDAFAVDARLMFFKRAQEKQIPLITAAPIGFGTAVLIFTKESPRAEEFLAIRDDMTYLEKLISMYVALAPSMLHRSYMQGVKLKEKQGPSSIAGVNFAAAMVVSYALKLVLKRGSVKAVPYYHQFDAYTERYVCKRLFWGNRGLLQRLKIRLALRMFR